MNLENLSDLVSYSEKKVQRLVLQEREKQKIILLAFSPGQSLPSHVTLEDALLIVLEGTCRFLLAEDEGRILKPGQVIRIPALVPHAVVALTYFKMILVK